MLILAVYPYHRYSSEEERANIYDDFDLCTARHILNKMHWINDGIIQSLSVLSFATVYYMYLLYYIIMVYNMYPPPP